MSCYPPMLCPACGANVFAGVADDGRIDLQAAGRMPICRGCAELLIVDGGRLRSVRDDELAELRRRGVLDEVRAVQQALIDWALGRDPLRKGRR